MSTSDIILDSSTLKKYITPLPEAQLLTPMEKFCGGQGKLPLYIITMEQGNHKLHPDLPPTTLWTFNGLTEFPLINNKRYCGIYVKWVNNLPTKALLEQYIDHTLAGAGTDVPDVRNVVHLHGGEQSAFSDGGPLEWFVPGQHVIYHYPNEQPPTMLFFHDHAMGITRLNNYAGITGGIYIIRDKKIEKPLNLPRGKYEVPMVIFDRTFSVTGQLVYSTKPSNPAAHPIWAATFLGNTILVNNAIWPYLNVEPCKYRFRIVNASDTRTYGLKLVNATTTNPGPPFYQIGTDGSYLPEPIILNDPSNPNSPNLLLAIGERADIIIDFSGFSVGTEFIMINTANAPFPNGSAPDPNTVGQIMKFIVVPSTSLGNEFCIKTPTNLFKPLNPNKVTVKRQLLLQVAGPQTIPTALYLNNSSFMNPVTENPKVGSTELWEFINMTNGMHPMHIHLIQFQLFNRQAYNATQYKIDWTSQNKDVPPGGGNLFPLDVTPYLQGDPINPQGTNEYAWKDVIRANGNEVTRILVRFAPQTNGTHFPFNPTLGQYVWHCHIQAHEDNEMMRPYQLFCPEVGLEPSIPHLTTKYEYCADYVIVGSGAGGASIANQLIQSKKSVILIEAGAEHDYDSVIHDSYNANILPINYFNQYFWPNGETTPQVNVNDRTFDYTGGRLLGGSTSINGMQYVRGTNNIFEKWENITCDSSYGPKNIFKEYTEFENYHGFSTTIRGECGLVDIRQAPDLPTTMTKKFVAGVTAVTGLPEILDYNDPNTPIGPFTKWQLYQHRNGSRVSSSTAYLDPFIDISKDGFMAHGSNLRILMKATTIRILWGSKDNCPKAEGVLILQNGNLISVKATRKVIISAGIMTPPLLLHSGIGPVDELRKIGIPVVYDNPNVGRNLTNHTMITLTASANPDEMGINRLDDLYVGGAFLPDPSTNSVERGLQLIGINPTSTTFQIVVIPIQPKSKGNIKLYSSDTQHVPIIDIGYFTDPADLVTLKAAIRQVNNIINNMGDPLYKLMIPDPATIENDALLEAFIKDNLDQTHHWTGSCRMTDNEKTGVVDPSGKVFGVKGLIIADATIIPVQNDGNVSGPTYIASRIIGKKLCKH